MTCGVLPCGVLSFLPANPIYNPVTTSLYCLGILLNSCTNATTTTTTFSSCVTSSSTITTTCYDGSTCPSSTSCKETIDPPITGCKQSVDPCTLNLPTGLAIAAFMAIPSLLPPPCSTAPTTFPHCSCLT